MREGRNRIVRRLFESQGLQVSRLIRIAYGPIELGRGIKAGSYREADPDELSALLQAVKMEMPAAPARAPRKPRSLMAKTYRPNAGPRKPRKR
jgi:23S rRNA pseudouridine2605 synthase